MPYAFHSPEIFRCRLLLSRRNDRPHPHPRRPPRRPAQHRRSPRVRRFRLDRRRPHHRVARPGLQRPRRRRVRPRRRMGTHPRRSHRRLPPRLSSLPPLKTIRRVSPKISPRWRSLSHPSRDSTSSRPKIRRLLRARCQLPGLLCTHRRRTHPIRSPHRFSSSKCTHRNRLRCTHRLAKQVTTRQSILPPADRRAQPLSPCPR